MRHKIRFMMLLLAVMVSLLASAVGPRVVFAEDGVPPEIPTEEPVGDEPLTEETELVAPADEGETSEETESEGTLPVVDTTSEDPADVVEIMEQLPEGTELVVVNETGEIEPLASEAAVEIIITGDPMWCPEGATPGDAGCTGSFTDFESLIATLTTDGGTTYSGNGVIWVEDSYNGNDNNQIEFDGATLSWLSNLTIQGGWSGSGTTITPDATSDFDVSMIFVNWVGNISLSNLNFVAADGAGFGLSVQNTGTTTMDNVSVSNTTENAYGMGDGAVIDSTGDVDITDSEFDDNAGNGLIVASGGNIELDTVSASNNTLTGAYLDSCNYNNVTGLCTGTGNVDITSAADFNLFNSNGFTGLMVDSGGGISIEFTYANGNGLDGANLTSADNDGTGDVIVYSSDFSDNIYGVGLDVLTDGNLFVEDVFAQNNGTGAVLDSNFGNGYVTVVDSNFGDSDLTGNYWTGLHIDSGSNVTLQNVVASFNGTNGAYITAEGDISITDSEFNNNVQFNFPQDPGLFALSNGGNITLVDVVADGNIHGTGAVLSTNGSGAVNISSVVPGTSHFNGNGLNGLSIIASDGGVILDGVDASYNDHKGVYIDTNGQGNVFIHDGYFTENGYYGIYTGAGGDIELDQVQVDGDDGGVNTTDVGAFLWTYSGNVFVTDSSFVQNTNTGLKIVSNGTVELTNVTADDNGGNGIEVYSTYTAGCIDPDSEVKNVVVNVDGGNFTNNGKYGIMVKPGPTGTLVFLNPAAFGGNGLGEYLIDLSSPEICPVEPPSDPDEDTGKPDQTNIVTVPSTGGEPVEQQCDLFASTILQLPNGSWINVGCPFEGFSNLEELPETNLPGELGAGTSFISGVTVSLMDEEGNSILNEDGTVTVNFSIPSNSRARSYSILFWDPTLNNGKGGWMKLPIFEFGTSFPLHPDDPNDERLITSGVQVVGNTISFTVNFPGVFVMVSP